MKLFRLGKVRRRKRCRSGSVSSSCGGGGGFSSGDSFPSGDSFLGRLVLSGPTTLLLVLRNGVVGPISGCSVKFRSDVNGALLLEQ